VNTGGEQQLITNLMILNPGNIASLADGIRVQYNDNYIAGINDDDEKMGNFAENISSYRGGKKLIVERRPMIGAHDTIFLRISNTGIKDYRLQIGAIDFVQTGIPAHLEDSYLGTSSSIELGGTVNNYDFSITADPASAAQDRFRIVFGTAVTSLPVLDNGISIYPNPAVNNTVGLQFTGMEKGVYTVRLINNMGQVVFTQQLEHSGANSLYSLHPGAVARGNYKLEFIKPDRSRVVKALVLMRN
jgi:hypothetical protein